MKLWVFDELGMILMLWNSVQMCRKGYSPRQTTLVMDYMLF
jgi:hypothetical protein